MRSAQVLAGAFILAHAWAAPPAPAGIAACRHISDDKQRLACFDRESSLQQPQRRAAKAEQTRAGDAEKGTGAAPPARPVLTPEQRIGLTPSRILKLQGSEASSDLKELTAKIRTIAGDPAARRSFILENGQVWQQVEPDSEFYVRPGDTVRISKALFGSYFMSVNPHMNTRVTRAR